MKTVIEPRSDTSADTVPSFGVLVTRSASDFGEAQLLAHVVARGRAHTVRLELLPGDSGWHEALGFLAGALSTSTVGSLVAPLDDDAHPVPTSADSVRRLKERSGLTWEQLARAFGVSRRAVHAWARGGRMSARNAERLEILGAAVDQYEQETPQLTRDALLKRTPEGVSPFQVLVGSAHDDIPTVDLLAMLASTGEGPSVTGEPMALQVIEERDPSGSG